MNRAFHRAATAVLAAGLCGTLLLSGCKPHTTTTQAEASATPEAKAGIALSGLRIVLPRVAEHPAALYFSLTNTGTSAVKLIGVFVDGATKSDMHETTGDAMKPLKDVDVAPGATVPFAPGGKHVMLYRIPGTWKPGDKPAVTLKFADGDKVSGKAIVQSPQGADLKADGSDTMPGMKM